MRHGISGLEAAWVGGSLGRFVSILLIVGLAVPFATADALVSADPVPQWPEHWTVVDDDAVDGGDAFQDVVSARTAWDASYLYLSLETAAAPSCALNARYSWFLGVGETSGLQLSGNTLEGATHLLFVEDAGDGSCAIYLLPANGDDTFSAYQASAYVTDPGPALASVAGSRVDGNHIEMYVRLGELEVDGVVPTSPLGMELVWASNQITGTLTQLVGDRPDDADIPLGLTPKVSLDLSASPNPVDAGATLSCVATLANLSGEPLVDSGGDEFEVTIPEHTTVIFDSLRVDGMASPSVHYDSGSGAITWNGGIEVGGEVEISYDVTVDSPMPCGQLISSQAWAWYDSDDDGENDASVPSDDPASSAAYDPTVVAVVSAPELVLEVPERLQRTRAGSTRSYDITFRNEGNAVADDVVLELILEPGLSLVAVQPPDGGDGIWSTTALSPLDGTLSVRVTLRVDSRLRSDVDLISSATMTIGAEIVATATTVLPAYVPRESGGDGSGGFAPAPAASDDESPEEQTAPDEPAEPALPIETLPVAPSATLSRPPDGSDPDKLEFTLSLAAPSEDAMAAWLYFRAPDGFSLREVRPLQGRVCDADANAALMALAGNLAGPDVAVVTLASIAATLGNVGLCPCLYVVLHHQALRADGTGATLRLSVFEVGGCRAEGVELRLAFPPVVSVIGARAAERGIISVTPHEIVARLGGLEPHSCSSLFVDIVDRAEGGVDSALADLVSGAASPLDISAL